MIHEILRQLQVKDQRIDALLELTERLTMGELPWDEYLKQANALLKDLLDEYRRSNKNTE